jgi:hypothetical protein
MSVEVNRTANFAECIVTDSEGRKFRVDVGNRGLRIKPLATVGNPDHVCLLVGDDLRVVMAVYLDIYNESLASSW